jgi:hypothetical protein
MNSKLKAMQERAIRIGKANRTHGESYSTGNTAEYKVWAGMMRRCYNQNDHAYSEYGGRGIVVCDRWHQYENFLSDMGRRLSPRHTIERVDNNKGYEPTNCCWATYTVQARNRRDNRFVTYQGITLCLAEWAERFGIPYKLLHQRLQRDGRSFEEAISTRNRLTN